MSMWNGLGRKIRLWALWGLIIADLLFIALLAWQKVWIWCWFVVGVTGLVILFELIWYSLEKKTISTEYKLFIQRNAWLGYTGLFLFTAVMISLIIHLAVW